MHIYGTYLENNKMELTIVPESLEELNNIIAAHPEIQEAAHHLLMTQESPSIPISIEIGAVIVKDHGGHHRTYHCAAIAINRYVAGAYKRSKAPAPTLKKPKPPVDIASRRTIKHSEGSFGHHPGQSPSRSSFGRIQADLRDRS